MAVAATGVGEDGGARVLRRRGLTAARAGRETERDSNEGERQGGAARQQGTRREYSCAMKCCQAPSGYEELFSKKQAERDARSYRRKGLGVPAQWIVDVVRGRPRGAAVLEPGGGIGAIQIELLKAGAARSTVVELSPAYEEVAAELARGGRRRRARGADVGDFAADGTEPRTSWSCTASSAVTDYERLLTAAASKARRTLVYTYPPRNILSAAMTLLNFSMAEGLRVSRVRPPASGDGGDRPAARLSPMPAAAAASGRLARGGRKRGT